ncbi:MAG: universal stress protein [Dehalococcoidia bacterium]
MEFKRILVAVNGSKMDGDIVQLASNLAKKHKGKVFVTYVIQLERTLPLDAEVDSAVNVAEQTLDSAERCAAECDYEVNTDLLQARAVGPALVNEAIERGVDLILMGMSYKTKFGEFSLGHIVPHVLKNAPCHVMLLREPSD